MNGKLVSAFHESGHAVCAAVLGASVKSADIIPNGNHGGVCEYHSLPDDCVSQIAIILAGSMAVWEQQWRRGAPMSYGAYSDLEQIDSKLQLWYRGKMPPHRERCDEYTEAEELVRATLGDYWGAVESVAEYLLSHDSIRGVLVHEIVKTHQQQVARSIA